MQNLEKILEEIEQKKERCLNIVKIEVEPMEITAHRERYKGLCMAEEIIRKHMNDGWIPVDERMPTQEECKDNLFWITYGSFSSSSRIAKCQWIFSYDENGNDDSYSEFWIDQSPCIYTPSQNLVKAWKIMDIPEPYRPERSEGE